MGILQYAFHSINSSMYTTHYYHIFIDSIHIINFFKSGDDKSVYFIYNVRSVIEF